MKNRPLLSALLTGLIVAASFPALAAAEAPRPERLRDTGLYEAGPGLRVRAGNEAFTPAHPLWTDGMGKRRWIYLPPGTSIDKSNPDAWEFPRGTRVWKEFSREGRVETRLIERLADGTWRFSAYVWNADGTDAVLAPEDGIPKLGIPSRTDCLACHEGAPVPVLGYSAVQLSREAIAGPTPATRAVLGYLHGNCGHCHNEAALPALGLTLAQGASRPAESAAATLASLIGRYSRFRPKGATDVQRVVPGNSQQSLLVARMRSHDPLVRMPPLGVSLVDAEGLALIENWIDHDLQPRQEK